MWWIIYLYYHVVDDISSLSIPVNKSSTYVLQKNASKFKFVFENHECWGLFQQKVIVNIFFNKQKLSKNSVSNDNLKTLKKQKKKQRKK